MRSVALAAATEFLLVIGFHAGAETRTVALSGSSLELRDICAANVVIEPAADLSGGVIVEEVTGATKLYDRLALRENGAILIVGSSEACRSRTDAPLGIGGSSMAMADDPLAGQSPDSAEPDATVMLRVRVPFGFPLAIHCSVVCAHTIGPVSGPVHAELAGAADLRASDVDGLDVTLRGSGRLLVDHVTGDTNIRVMSGGDVDILSGSIEKLTVSVEGAGTVHVGAVSEEADLAVSGTGEISVAPVDGPLRQSVRGSGRILVTDR